jgi:hypothetical protein
MFLETHDPYLFDQINVQYQSSTGFFPYTANPKILKIMKAHLMAKKEEHPDQENALNNCTSLTFLDSTWRGLGKVLTKVRDFSVINSKMKER